MRDTIEDREIHLQCCEFEHQIDDIMSKVLPKYKFQYLIATFGVQELHINGRMLMCT